MRDPSGQLNDPMFFSEAWDGDCPRCGNNGCRHCAARLSEAERYGFPVANDPPLSRFRNNAAHGRDPEDEDADEDYGGRLTRGVGMLAESDDSLLDE